MPLQKGAILMCPGCITERDGLTVSENLLLEKEEADEQF